MISEFENLSLGGNNTATNHADPFTHTELTPEQQKTLIDIRRRKTELLLEIQNERQSLALRHSALHYPQILEALRVEWLNSTLSFI